MFKAAEEVKSPVNVVIGYELSYDGFSIIHLRYEESGQLERVGTTIWQLLRKGMRKQTKSRSHNLSE